jgi:hypothetical protein
MATFAAQRPQFFEGQYLGAADLEAIVAYLRTNDARQNLGQHSWGVAIGLNLVSQPISDTAVEYFVQPGVAIDGYGRLIVVQSPTRLDPAQLNGAGSGLVDVWIRFDQGSFMATRPGFGACSASDEYARVSEGFRLVFGSKQSIVERESGVTLNEALVIDAREALSSVDPEAPLLLDGAVPHQELPLDDAAALWLVPLGHVRWAAASNNFLPLVDAAEAEALENGSSPRTPDQVYEALMQSRAKRRLLGVVAEAVFAAEGLIRLRERTAPADPINGNDAVSKAHAVKSRDLCVCDGQLKPKELIWLEGNVRVTGDARLLAGRLEFRNAEGRDYVPRTVDGSMLAPSTPLVLQRSENNPRGGTDLQLLLGKSSDGRNRFSIGGVEYEGTDLCDLSASINTKVVIQDDGKVGIGTLAPDTLLTSPVTVRGLSQSITENPGTPEQEIYNIYRLATFEGSSGNNEWQLDLWDREGSERKSLSFTESALGASRLFLESGGRIGVGTREPGELLHLFSNDPALFIDIAGASPQQRAELVFGTDGAPTGGLYWNKGSGELVLHHGEFNNVALSDQQLRLQQGGVDAMTIRQQRVGLGTPNPNTTLHVATGSDVTLGADSGYVLIGNANTGNMVLDDNEIQARSNGAPARLHLQAEGGELSVHFYGGASEFRINDNGAVGIGTDAPAAKLDVRGNIRLGASGELHAVAGVESLRLVAGQVDSNGNEVRGAGFSASRTGTGVYNLFFAPPFAAPPVVVASPFGADTNNIAVVVNANAAWCEIQVRDIGLAGTGSTNGAFTFTATGLR